MWPSCLALGRRNTVNSCRCYLYTLISQPQPRSLRPKGNKISQLCSLTAAVLPRVLSKNLQVFGNFLLWRRVLALRLLLGDRITKQSSVCIPVSVGRLEVENVFSWPRKVGLVVDRSSFSSVEDLSEKLYKMVKSGAHQ